ncbi:Acetyl-CoA carboxylase, central region [Popillia japonica]|uniref:Acetyl-CoA carboxylase, central region n=1 Tax=Popillia japonica TaxID=7064 RepID=A0AAW1ML38_POPJA
MNKRAERDGFFLATEGIVQLVQRYRNGIRGRMKAAVHDLLKQYFNVESQFQQGHYDKCVSALRAKHKDDMALVSATIFSHGQVAKKNMLVTMLIDHLWANEPGLTDELAATLNELTSLNRSEHSRVALRARQVLIAAHQPAYELRHNQMESIFLSAVDMYGHEFHPENLQKLIVSETSIFDILHDFFYHTNRTVCNAALEVYVRRAYTSYDITCLQHLELSGEVPLVHFQFFLPSAHPDITCLQHLELSGEVPLVHFQFFLPSAHPNRLIYLDNFKVKDEEGPSSLTSQVYNNFQRTGCMAAFENFQQFEQYADEIFDLIEDFASPAMVSAKDLNAVESGSESRTNSTSINVSLSVEGARTTVEDNKTTVEDNKLEEPIHILHIGIKDKGDADDSTMSRIFGTFCARHKEELLTRGIRRITFAALKRKQFPKFFTYRARDGFKEDRIYRHLEPETEAVS